MLGKMSLKYKLLLGFLFVGFLPAAIIGAASLIKAESALHELAFSQMKGMRDVKKGQVVRYLEMVKNQAITFSEDHGTVDAMAKFSEHFETFLDENDIDSSKVQDMKSSLSQYYKNDFAAEYEKTNDGKSPDVQSVIDQLDDHSVALQYYYIKANDSPLGSKDELEKGSDSSEYSHIHEEYHPSIRDYLKKFGYYDIFLVHHETGRIVYSVYKELDFATSLKNGPYAETNFAEAFKSAAKASKHDAVFFVDFKQYFPSYEAPAGFVASPIFYHGEKIGVVVFQFPIDNLNRIMGERSGMGESGETYLIGHDLLMRSDSYLDQKNHTVAASFRHPEKGAVDTEAARKAVDGDTGEKIIIDYNGNPVLSAFTPIGFEGLKWALLAEIDESEAFRAVNQLEKLVLIVAIISIALIIVFAIVLTRPVIKPINRVVHNLTELSSGEGDLTQRLPVTTEDEIGQLAMRFNDFMDKLQDMIKGIKQGVGTLSSSSTQMSSASEELSGIAGDTSERANAVAAAAEEMSANMNSVAASMEESSVNINTVSSAAEEMNSTINEIAQNAEKARHIVVDAVEKTDASTQMMGELGDAAKAIGQVVETITDISEQVNLLSLNATIEAARAGEAGKGFAVVANEIKDLANQTSNASMDIKEKIDNIQESSNGALDGMDQIKTVISDVNEIVSTIATAVEEQSSATSEISENIGQASTGIEEVNMNINQSASVADEITRDIGNINNASTDITDKSGDVNSSANSLSELSNQLDEMVGRFKV